MSSNIILFRNRTTTVLAKKTKNRSNHSVVFIENSCKYRTLLILSNVIHIFLCLKYTKIQKHPVKNDKEAKSDIDQSIFLITSTKCYSSLVRKMREIFTQAKTNFND